MFDAELLRKLCQELTHERDPERLHELLSLLCALVHDDDEQELRTLRAKLSRRYPSLSAKST